MTFPRTRSPLLSLLLTAVAACGGSPASPEAKAPPPAPASSATPPPPAPLPSASAAAPAEPAPAASAEAPKAADKSTEITRSVGDRLLAPTIAYMLNYNSSGAREKVAAACDAASHDDPAAKAACIEKERNKIVSDVLVFDKTDKGTIWTIYRRTGSTLVETWKGPVEFADDSPEHVTVKIQKVDKDKEKGTRQLYAGKKELTITSASDSSVELDEPTFGKLVYEARIGLVERK